MCIYITMPQGLQFNKVQIVHIKDHYAFNISDTNNI